MTTAKQAYPVARTEEVPVGSCKIVEVAGRSIGLYNVHGSFIAVLNLCPHELAPICRGRVGGTTLDSAPGEFRWGREGEILACPWHGWEFDLLTGACLTDKRKLRRYPVHIEDGVLHVTM